MLCGGVLAPVDIPYLELMVREITNRGVLMYPRSATAELLSMIAAGTLDLAPLRIETVGLSEITHALELASRMKGLNYCTVRP